MLDRTNSTASSESSLPDGSARRQLEDLLSRYTPIDRRDRDTLAAFREFVLREERCFERSLAQGHVTGSAWLSSPDERSVLLTHHRKLGRWLQVGGHADGESDILAVALREAREESGILDIVPYSTEILDLDIHEIPERGREPAHLHYDVRFALKALSSSCVRSEESHEIRWVAIDELQLYTTSPSIARMREKWLAIRPRGV